MTNARTIFVLGIMLLPFWGCEKAPAPVAKVGLTPSEIELPYPGVAKVKLHWEMLAPLEVAAGEPTVFVHVLDAESNVERTFDHPLPFAWQPGTSQDYDITLYQSALAPPMDTGTYRVSLGIYDSSGQRWALAETGAEIAKLEYQVGTLGTEGDPAAVPMFYFSPSWLPLEAGTDVQILGRRWLTDEGTIRVAEVLTAGTVWLVLQVSEPVPDLEELALEEGTIEPGFTLSSTCGGEETAVSGYGRFELQVPVGAGEDGQLPEECEILLRPNFQIVEVDTLARRSVGLEILGWSAD